MAGEWTLTTLGEIAQLHEEQVTPASTPDAVFHHFSIPAFDAGRTPVVEIGSAIGSNKFVVPRDAVLVSKLNPRIPRVWEPDVPTSARAVASTEFLVLRPRNLVDRRFLRFLCLAPTIRSEMEARVTGTSGSHQRVRPEDALAIPVEIPVDLSEQRAIAHILGTLDDKIEVNRRMSQTLEAMARALFKAWFVDFDPVRAKMEGRWQRGQSLPGLPAHLYDLFPARLVDSELGEIPEGWRVVELEQVIEINPPRVLRKGQRAPFLDMASMPTRGHVPLRVVERPYTSGTRFMNGDTLLARITPCLENGKTAFVDFLAPNEVGWGSTEFIVLRPKPPLSVEFGYCLARDSDFREFAIQSMTGTSGRQRVQPEALARYLLVVPSDGVAKAFGALVEPWFRKASASERESRTLAALRDALLPKLIRGEIRVKEMEQLVLQHVSNTQKED